MPIKIDAETAGVCKLTASVDVEVTLLDTGATVPTTRLWTFTADAGDFTEDNPFGPGFPSALAAAPVISDATTVEASFTPSEDGCYVACLIRDLGLPTETREYALIAVPDADGMIMPCAGLHHELINTNAEATREGWAGDNAPGWLEALVRFARDGVRTLTTLVGTPTAAAVVGAIAKRDDPGAGCAFGYVAAGTSPATGAGKVRLAEGSGNGVAFLNDAGDGNVAVLETDGADTILAGEEAVQVKAGDFDAGAFRTANDGTYAAFELDPDRTDFRFMANEPSQLVRLEAKGSGGQVRIDTDQVSFFDATEDLAIDVTFDGNGENVVNVDDAGAALVVHLAGDERIRVEGLNVTTTVPENGFFGVQRGPGQGFFVDPDYSSGNTRVSCDADLHLDAPSGEVLAQGYRAKRGYDVVKEADQSVASTTLDDDDDLAFAIGAGEKWTFEFVLFVNLDANGGFKFQVTAPASPTAAIVLYGYTDGILGTVDTALDTPTADTGIGAANANTYLRIMGSIVNGANAGTVQLEFAENSGGGGVAVKAASYLKASRSS